LSGDIARGIIDDMVRSDDTASSEADARISRLLLKALESLEPEERAAVLESLIGRALSLGAAPSFAPILAPTQPQLGRSAFAAPLGGAPPAADQRMFPVRLPERDHGRLKLWCEQHNFPMAVVVRGLIERFLEAQGQHGAPEG
jgi:hypothetical protein